MANLLDPLFPTLIVIVYHFVFVVFLGAGGGGEKGKESSSGTSHTGVGGPVLSQHTPLVSYRKQNVQQQLSQFMHAWVF